MILLRIVNAFYAALFLVMALVSVAFLSASLHDRVRAPLDVWVSIGWVALFLLYAVLTFLNMRGRGGDAQAARRIALNLAAALPMAAGLFVADPATRFLCGVAMLPFALTAAAWLVMRRCNPA
jgi:NADH:ubiquinone oxidoreductase subunit 6 (subunit J)